MGERSREGREVEEGEKGEGEMVTEGDRDEGEGSYKLTARGLCFLCIGNPTPLSIGKWTTPRHSIIKFLTLYFLLSFFNFSVLHSLRRVNFMSCFFSPLHFLFFMFFPPQHFLLHVWWHLVWNTSEQLSVYSQRCRMEGKFPWRRRALGRNFSTIHTWRAILSTFPYSNPYRI